MQANNNLSMETQLNISKNNGRGKYGWSYYIITAPGCDNHGHRVRADRLESFLKRNWPVVNVYEVRPIHLEEFTDRHFRFTRRSKPAYRIAAKDEAHARREFHRMFADPTIEVEVKQILQ